MTPTEPEHDADPVEPNNGPGGEFEGGNEAEHIEPNQPDDEPQDDDEGRADS